MTEVFIIGGEMICPKCGFPEADKRCDLCGLERFSEFEVNRYEENHPNRFELTLSFPASEKFEAVEKLLNSASSYKKTAENNPRYFVYFTDGNEDKLFIFLQGLEGKTNWELLVNGRPRAYTEELWLPMLELLASINKEE